MVKQIDPTEAAQRLEAGEVTYLDVRSVLEFEKGHPPGAVNVPLLDYHDGASGLQQNQRFVDVIQRRFDTNSNLIVACAAGGRSKRAAMLLAEAGFNNVVDMLGGYSGKRDPMGGYEQLGWVQCELPSAQEPADGESYKQVLGKID